MSAVLSHSDVRREPSDEALKDTVADAKAAPDLASTALTLPPLTAVQRLDASREKLRLAMMPPPKASHAARPPSTGHWYSALSHLPGIDLLIESAKAWWMLTPLRPVATVVTEATNVAARPLAANNPLAFIAVAALAGAALAWARPWRWMLRSALFAGLVPQFASRVVAKMPIESWLTMLSTALRSPKPPRPSPTTAPAASPTAATGR